MAVYEVYAHTETGLVRSKNEDHILAGRFIKNQGNLRFFFSRDDDFLKEHGLLFAIADGIGGEAAGEVASKEALKSLEHYFYEVEKNNDPRLFMEALKKAIHQSNQGLLKCARDHIEYARMGCTLSGICLASPQYFVVFNVGDSRVYRYRAPSLTLLTEDDTVSHWAMKNGKMSLTEARRSTQRHRLTNFLGYESFFCTIERGPLLHIEDVILICSDGLHDLVEENYVAEILSEKTFSLPTLGKKLIDKAIDNGGNDNISLILIRYGHNGRAEL